MELKQLEWGYIYLKSLGLTMEQAVKLLAVKDLYEQGYYKKGGD